MNLSEVEFLSITNSLSRTPDNQSEVSTGSRDQLSANHNSPSRKFSDSTLTKGLMVSASFSPASDTASSSWDREGRLALLKLRSPILA